MSIIQIDDYQFSQTEENKLGSGTYASVYKGIHKLTKKAVAVKVINFDGRSAQDQHYLLQEINLMKEIDHPNVIKFYAMKKIGPCIYLVIEYCSGKDLKALLEKQPGKRLDEDTARHYLCQFASGLRYLNEKGIIHRDLKPHNLLLTESNLTADLKICDFGFARKIDPLKEMNSILGSPLYMAPEILCGRAYTAKSDLWSVGCIFYEMLMGHTPLAPTSMAHLRQLASDGRPVLNFPVRVSPLCKELLEGLLQKKNQQRYDWKQFLEHPYLTPENLSRSMLIKPENVQPNINDCRWLQRVCTFYPSAEHTLYVKPWNLISEVKSILSKLVGAPMNDLLLFDSTGKLLHDHLQLNYYQFQQRDQPIYVITKSSLDLHQNFPPYQFKYDLPYPSLLVPVNPEIPLDATIMSRLNAVQDGWQFKGDYLKLLYKNLKMQKVNVVTCKGQYENQFAIYKVLRSHVISRASELSRVLQPVEELYNKQKSLVEPLLKSSDNVLIELRNTRIHDALQPIAKAQNLLELVDGKKFFTDCSRLRDEFSTLATNFNSATDSVQKTKEEIDSLVRAKLDENQYNQITETVTEMSNTIEKARIAVDNFQDRYKKANKTVQSLRDAGSKRTEAETEQALKNYTELSKLFSTVTSLDEESSNLASTCKQAMVKATDTMIVHLQAMGKVLFNTENILASIQFVQTVLLQLQQTIVSCKKVSKLHNTYIECLKEIQRRREYKQLVENIHSVWYNHFHKNVYENELKKRLAFKQLYGEDLMVQLTPFFIKSEQEEMMLPYIQLILQNAENLPQISQVPVSLEDDFLVINDFSNPTEVLKTLQQENAKLLELLNNLQKQEIERKSNIHLVTNEQIVELQEELSALKKDQKPIHPVPDPAFLALKEDFSNCQTQMKQMHTEIQSLQSKNQTLLTKLNEKQVAPPPPNPNLDQLNQQVAELKGKLAEAENRIVNLVNPDIQRLQEMGFPLELAKEAMLSNKTVHDATNWLLEHSKIQPKV